MILLNAIQPSSNPNIGTESNYKRHDEPVDFSWVAFIAKKGNEAKRLLKVKKKKKEE